MRFAIEHRFATNPDAVYAMFSDEAFLDHACAALGADEFETSATDDHSVASAVVPAPEAMGRFVGSHMTVRQEFAWDSPVSDGSRQGTMSLSVAGAPVSLTGSTRLAPADAGTVFTLDAVLTVSVPLFGPAVEKMAVPDVSRLLDAQLAVGDTWLADH